MNPDEMSTYLTLSAKMVASLNEGNRKLLHHSTELQKENDLLKARVIEFEQAAETSGRKRTARKSGPRKAAKKR